MLINQAQIVDETTSLLTSETQLPLQGPHYHTILHLTHNPADKLKYAASTMINS